MGQPSYRSYEAAEALAIQALNFLATDPARLSRFLALSGLDPASIRAAAGESGVLGGGLAPLGEGERRAGASRRGREAADGIRSRRRRHTHRGRSRPPPARRRRLGARGALIRDTA